MVNCQRYARPAAGWRLQPRRNLSHVRPDSTHVQWRERCSGSRSVETRLLLMLRKPYWARRASVRLRPKREEAIRYWFQMPHCLPTLCESPIPFIAEFGGNAPPFHIVSKPHPYEVAFLRGVQAIDKTVAAVQDSEIINEVDITWFGAHLSCIARPMASIAKASL